ncbi:DNA repair protein UVH3 isoform X3 [Mercurialis annua]|uniref:DNA repair protein UVH3 isoform X3 n=1 Tax=Mercurialis annua TaxID=3986 RepID=UPI00216103CB|nr:DNA repair protein UVH3 isoform X3 [Mercurialis annua]
MKSEEEGHFNYSASTSAGRKEEDSDESEEIILPAMDGNVDPSVLASLPPSMQHDILMSERLIGEKKRHNQEVIKQNKDHMSNAEVTEVLIDLTDTERSDLKQDDLVAKNNQEKLDEMLAASIVAEQEERLTKTASTSAAAILSEEEGNDEDEEMILPAMFGKVDPAVLAALPPSMQLDLLVQMRERLMAENRQKYQKVKKAPEKFSELQIEAYLKTVAFRREIDQVQKAAAGNGVGGVQSSRIASEANREFIFSSSFTGDKQLLASNGVHRNGNKHQQTPLRNPFSDSANSVPSSSKSNAVIGFVQDESRGAFDEDVETYLDERGCIRVSRVRAMGMRMTRDLQRNLDLMKEVEQERTHANKTASVQPEPNRDKTGSPKGTASENLQAKSSHDKNGESVKSDERTQQLVLENKGSIQISFEVDDCFDNDDDVFTSLVAAQSVNMPSADNVALRGQISDSSDGDWEEGVIDTRGDSAINDLTLETNPQRTESIISDDSEVEWEDGGGDHENSLFPSESRKPASRSYLEEEADLQEAIRRSLEESGGEKFNTTPLEHEDDTAGFILPEKDVTQQDKFSSEVFATRKMDRVGQSDIAQVSSSLSQSQMKLSEMHDPDNKRILTNKSYVKDMKSNDEQPSQDTREFPSAESAAPLEANETHVAVKQSSDTKNRVGVSHVPEAACGSLPCEISSEDKGDKVEAKPYTSVNEGKNTESSCHLIEITSPSTSIMEPSIDSTIGTDWEPNLGRERNSDHQYNEEQDMDKFASNENLQADFSETTLQEEILILDQESRNLGSEQKKLERNAESVSSEMFAECQELLQMFGLPYIIAPMEAEAQCAYMELVNLVDGVVTDDSDVLLFGASNVYKNIFDDRKYVETYFMKDIEKELGLTREKLIRMALLLGSDYTEGISGIGIVNAIEVVNAFPEGNGLEKFREWIESPDPTILRKFDLKTDASMMKKGDPSSGTSNSRVDSFNQNISEAHKEEDSADRIHDTRQIFMDKHRNVSKNWHVPSSFPSEAVISAYLCPQVDKSTEPFTWGKPDLNVLRRLCWEKFAWGLQKSDELLLPVLKEYNKHETQLRLEAFYTFNERFAKIRSKRIEKALKGIKGNQCSELMDDDVKKNTPEKEKTTITASKRAKGGVSSKKTKSAGVATAKGSRKRVGREPVLTEVDNSGQKSQCKDGRGKRRGRSVGKREGRGKKRGIEHSDSSEDHVTDGYDELEVCVEKSKGPQEVRRSARSRKPASYTEDDLETDVDRTVDVRCNKEAVEPGLFGVVASRDASTSHSVEEQLKVEDNLPGYLFKDYLERGKEGLSNNDVIGEAGVNPNNNPTEVGVSQDYFKMGGGFCIEESETDPDQNAAYSPSMHHVWETPDSSKLLGDTEEADRCKGSDPSVSSAKRTFSDTQHDSEPAMDFINAGDSGDHLKVSSSLPESTDSKTGGFRLSAMPFLKRKRRKN